MKSDAGREEMNRWVGCCKLGLNGEEMTQKIGRWRDAALTGWCDSLHKNERRNVGAFSFIFQLVVATGWNDRKEKEHHVTFLIGCFNLSPWF